jgi:hypothetical protein
MPLKYRTLLAAVALITTAVAFASSGTKANALTVDFSFDGGLVKGEIDGLTAGGTNEAATAVIVTNNGGVANLPTPFNFFASSNNPNLIGNSFNVDAAGDVTFASLVVGSLSGGSSLCLSTGTACAFSSQVSGVWVGVGPFTFSDLTFSSATPLPAALPLFATGLGGLGLLGWRRKRKAQAV